jgi:hypothetical protein
LPRDRRIFDLPVVGKHERLTQDDGQSRISLEGEKDVFRRVLSAGGDDAEVLVVGFHEDVAAAEVDFVGAEVAFDDEEADCQGAAVFDPSKMLFRKRGTHADVGRRSRAANFVALFLGRCSSTG